LPTGGCIGGALYGAAMAALLGIVVPLALAAAVSPTILAFQLVTLSRKTEPVQRAWGVAAGAALVLAGFAVLALALARSTGGSDSPSQAGAIVKLVAAALLVVIGVHALRAAPKPPKPESVAAHPLRRSLELGAGLMLTNFSSIVLFFPAMHEIGISDAGLGAQLVAFVLLYSITLLPAFAPPLLVGLLGARAAPLLERLNAFFAAHRRGIGAGLCFCFALLLALAAIKALT
jgi:threonine/homoserine/homoserine lactone efflux protein